MKYGVINVDHITQDLRDWTWLYAAGRCGIASTKKLDNKILDVLWTFFILDSLRVLCCLPIGCINPYESSNGATKFPRPSSKTLCPR